MLFKVSRPPEPTNTLANIEPHMTMVMIIAVIRTVRSSESHSTKGVSRR
jgi:hypothetical protein